MAEGVSEEQLRPVIKVQKDNESKLLALPGVVAVGVGLTQDGRPAIHVDERDKAYGGQNEVL